MAKRLGTGWGRWKRHLAIFFVVLARHSLALRGGEPERFKSVTINKATECFMAATSSLTDYWQLTPRPSPR
jgi:hypothetical protein